MAELKVVSWNCGGLRRTTSSTTAKTGFFSKQYPNHSFHLAAFLETHHLSEADFPPLIQEFALTHTVVHTPASSLHPYTGIIVIVHQSYEVFK